MCQKVKIKDTDIVFSSVRDLRHNFPTLKLVKKKSARPVKELGCLCQIHLDYTFNKAGVKFTKEGMDYIVE